MTDLTEANRLYESGNDHYRTAQELVSDKRYQEAVDHFIQAAEQYESAVQIRKMFPEAYHNWANVMTRLIPLTGTAELAQQALEKYLTSGLQFIVNGIPSERPFEEALKIIAENDRYEMIFRLYLIAIRYIHGENREKSDEVFFSRAEKFVESPEILIDLIDTLMGKNTEKLTIQDGDDLISSATKVLINTLIDAGT
jgi:HEPN domain-containing protein